MNFGRLFMLGNLSAEAPFPAKLPDWLKQIPEDLRKEALKAYLRRGRDLPEDVQLPIRELGPGKDVRAEWEEFFRKEKEGIFSPLPGQFVPTKVLDKELKNAIEALTLVEHFRQSIWPKFDPKVGKAQEEHIQDSLKTFFDRSEAAVKLIAKSNVQSAAASNLPEIEEAAQTLGHAKDLINRAIAIKNAFKTFFSKDEQANQEALINRLSENLSKTAQSIYPKKLKYTFEPMESAREAILRLSQKVISKEAGPEAINALEAGIRGIQRFASMISTMPDISDQERSRAKEALLLSESMRTLLRTYKEEFIEEVKVHSPQLSFPERFKQKQNVALLSKALDFLKDAFGRKANPEERFASLDSFSKAAANFNASVRLDPELIPILEETISNSIPVMRSVASVRSMGVKYGGRSEAQRSFEENIEKWLKSRGEWPTGDPNHKEVREEIEAVLDHWTKKLTTGEEGRTVLEQAQENAVRSFMTLNTFVQLTKEGRLPAPPR